MKITETQLQKSNEEIQNFNNSSTIKASIAIAFERTGFPLVNLEHLANDVVTEFKNVETETITKAIRNGSLGLYGRTYRMSTQEVCIWIREYLKTNKISTKKFIGNAYLKEAKNVTTI